MRSFPGIIPFLIFIAMLAIIMNAGDFAKNWSLFGKKASQIEQIFKR